MSVPSGALVSATAFASRQIDSLRRSSFVTTGIPSDSNASVDVRRVVTPSGYGWIITSHRRSCGATASALRTPVACTRSAACGRVAMNDVLNASLSRPISRTRACASARTTSRAGASSAVTSDVCVPKWPTVCPAPMRSRAMRSAPMCAESMRSSLVTRL